MADNDDQTGRGQPTHPNAIRDHLANERTLLAWIRTCLAIMALGFVVARFGLLIRELAGRPHPATPQFSTGIGIALVGMGGVLVLLSGGLVVVAILLVGYLVAKGRLDGCFCERMVSRVIDSQESYRCRLEWGQDGACDAPLVTTSW